MRFLLSVLATIAVCSIASAQAPEVVKNAAAGVQATKPAGWHNLSNEHRLTNLKRVDIKDPKLREAMLKSKEPAIAFSKYPEPYAHVNPNFKIHVTKNELTGINALDITKVVLALLGRAHDDFKIKQAPRAVTVAGLPAVHARMDYTMSNEGDRIPVSSEIWLVLKGDTLIMLGAGAHRDDAKSLAELRSIAESVRINP